MAGGAPARGAAAPAPPTEAGVRDAMPETSPGAAHGRVPQREPLPVTEHGRRAPLAPSTAGVSAASVTSPGVRPAPAGDSSLFGASMFAPPASAAALLSNDPAAAAAAAAMAAAAAASAAPIAAASAIAPLPEVSELDSGLSTIRSQISADDAYQVAAQADGASAKAYACLQSVYRVSEALVGVLDLDTMLARTLEQVLAAVPADRAYVILRDDAGTGFVVRAAQFREERHAENQMVVSRTLLRRVVDERVSLLVADAQAEFQSQHSIVSQGIRSVMCAPLAAGKAAFGAIAVDTLRSRNAFDGEDLKMLTAIGRQASIALENVRLLRRVEEDARTRGMLERYLSPELVEQVVSRKVDLKPGGQLCELTIMFSDIRGFTRIAATLDPHEVVELINEYFGIMVEVLFRHGATLDKFIGDSIMAFWGAPVKRDDDALRAVRCALEMQSQLAQFNRLLESSSQQQLAVGIGINTGQAIAGNIGSARRIEYTILGDAVNVASRLQGVALGGQILITESTYAKLGARVPATALPAVELRGRSGLVGVYSVQA
jgi:adenylate cyclase